jgi:hypothetical protein
VKCVGCVDVYLVVQLVDVVGDVVVCYFLKVWVVWINMAVVVVGVVGYDVVMLYACVCMIAGRWRPTSKRAER